MAKFAATEFSKTSAMLSTDPPFEPSVKAIETARLSIRIDTEQDYVRMFRTSSDEVIKQYFGIITEEELRKQKEKVWGGLTTYRTGVVFFHLIDRDLKRVVGNFAFHNWFPMHNRSEIGYMMNAEEYKNKRYMSEAIPPIIGFGFAEMSLNRIEAFVHPQNNPSRKLVEGNGFQHEGWLREHFCYEGITGDSLVYGLLRKDYPA